MIQCIHNSVFLCVSPQFLELVSTQPGYLSTVVEGLTIVIAEVEYEGHVVVGQKELLLHHRVKEEGVAGGGQDSVYRMLLSRVRCWKMAYLVRGGGESRGFCPFQKRPRGNNGGDLGWDRGRE